MRTAAMPTVCVVQHQHCKGKHSLLHSVHYILPHCHTSCTSQGFVQTRSFTPAAVNFTVRSACPAAARCVTSAAALNSHHELCRIRTHGSGASLAASISAVTPACPAAAQRGKAAAVHKFTPGLHTCCRELWLSRQHALLLHNAPRLLQQTHSHHELRGIHTHGSRASLAASYLAVKPASPAAQRATAAAPHKFTPGASHPLP